MAFDPNRRPLHNFDLPPPKWANQKIMIPVRFHPALNNADLNKLRNLSPTRLNAGDNLNTLREKLQARLDAIESSEESSSDTSSTTDQSDGSPSSSSPSSEEKPAVVASVNVNSRPERVNRRPPKRFRD